MSTSRGFSAIELLITLFVAAAFLVAGYQLFTVIISDGAAVRSEAQASDLAHEYMRRYSSSAQNPCVASVPVNNQSVSHQSLSNVRASVRISCPKQSNAPVLNKIEARIFYGSPQKEVVHSTFIDASRIATAAANQDVVDGLVAQWKLNGDGKAAVGGADGTVVGAVSSTGYGGVVNGAMRFNGTSSHIIVPTEDFPRIEGNISISAWFRLTGASTQMNRVISSTEGGGYALLVRTLNGSTAAKIESWLHLGANGYSTVYVDPATYITVGSWVHLVMTYDGSVQRVYANGVQRGATTLSGVPAYHSTAPLCIGAEAVATGCSAGYVDGDIDDVRVYNRALTLAEIQRIQAKGAQ